MSTIKARPSMRPADNGRIKALPSYDRLHEQFTYCPKTGKLFRHTVARQRTRLLGEAGTTTSRGYRSVSVDGETYLVHRIIWKMVHGTDPAADIDHINSDPADNRIENLREATRSENAQNARLSRNNTSGFKGVSWFKPAAKWVATLKKDGVRHHLGYFNRRQDAARAARNARTHLHGEYANHGVIA